MAGAGRSFPFQVNFSRFVPGTTEGMKLDISKVLVLSCDGHWKCAALRSGWRSRRPKPTENGCIVKLEGDRYVQ